MSQRRSQPGRLHRLLVGAGLAWAVAASSIAAHAAPGSAQRLAQLEQQARALPQLVVASGPPGVSPQSRLAEGKRLLALHDYERACVVLSDVVANHAQDAAYPEALFSWAEAALGARDWLGARAAYRTLIGRGEQALYRAYLQPALARSIEIALRLGQLGEIDADFARMAQLPAAQIDAGLHYLRGKYLYTLASGAGDPRLQQARVELAAVAPNSRDALRAGYFLGVVEMARGATASALAAFSQVAKAQARDADERRVVELAQLARARLYYDHELPALAISAYRALPADAASFDSALYERAWAHMRLGDVLRAERALELLDVAAPRSLHLPEAKLLRANLLLRDGRFAASSEAFAQTAAQFSPVRDDLDRVLGRADDPSVYFRELVRENLELFATTAFLPPSAQPWVATSDAMEPALDTLSELKRTRALVRETEALAARLSGVIASGRAANAFADLRAAALSAAALRNGVEQARAELVAGELDAAKAHRDPELDALRRSRARLEQDIARLPTSGAALEARAARSAKRYDQAREQLAWVAVEVAGLQARIAATEHYLEGPTRRPFVQVGERVRAQLSAERQALEGYRASMERLSRELEVGRLQVGPGDLDSLSDRSLWQSHALVAERERNALRALGAKWEPPASLPRLVAIEAVLSAFEARLQAALEARVVVIRGALEQEQQRLVEYRARIAELQRRSEQVVGALAHDDYVQVRRRFYDLVLRADVGNIDVAWAVRENYRLRGEQLSRDRVRELENLDAEYREVAEPRGGEP